MAKQSQSAQDIINESPGASAKQLINTSKSKPIKQMSRVENMRISRRVQQQRRNERVQKYQSQQSYAGLNKKNIINRVNRLRTERIPLVKRKMPGQTMIREESSGRITHFVTGKRSQYQSQGYAKAGRPKGSFYKYTIPGVGPVDVFTWRKWNRNQQRLMAIKMQQQNPGLSYPQARQAVKQTSTIYPQQFERAPQQNYLIQAQQAQQIPQPMPQQQYPQQNDGWNLLRVRSPLTLGTGAQVQRPVEPVMGINAQAPVGNKFTSYYSEPDFLSGRQVMRTRPNQGGFGLW